MSRKRKTAGNVLIHFSVFALVLSSAVKFLHPAKAVAYMGSLGYNGGTLYLVAGLELFSGAVFLFPSTRILGLLLVSSYLGGAISAHLAHHPAVAGGPFLVYMLSHPYTGALEPGVLLASAWLGTWLRHPQIHWSWGTSAAPSSHPAQ
jgi:DoxX-like protein